MNTFTILILIIVLFAVFLLARSLFGVKVCALCAGVSGTWLILLALFYRGTEVDLTILGLLLGGSVVGAMYLLEEKLPTKYAVFKLPFYLTLIMLSYKILGGQMAGGTLLLLGGLWVLFTALFFGRKTEGLKKYAKKVIECCKNW